MHPWGFTQREYRDDCLWGEWRLQYSLCYTHISFCEQDVKKQAANGSQEGSERAAPWVNACQRSWGISRATCVYDAPATSIKYWSVQPYRRKPWISAVFQYSLWLYTAVALFSRAVNSWRKFSSPNMDTSTYTQTHVASPLLMQIFACQGVQAYRGNLSISRTRKQSSRNDYQVNKTHGLECGFFSGKITLMVFDLQFTNARITLGLFLNNVQ